MVENNTFFTKARSDSIYIYLIVTRKHESPKLQMRLYYYAFTIPPDTYVENIVV